MRRDRIAFASAIIGGAFLTRLRSFQGSLGDGNVGTYLYVAHRWLDGALPYTTVWEYKPPGIFALYALALHACGDATAVSAVLGVVATSIAALAVAHVVRAAGGGSAPAIAAALVVLLSTENDGILNDAEVYVNAFVACAYAALAGSERRRLVIVAGLAASAALQMKLTALPLLAPLTIGMALRPGRFVRFGLFAAAALSTFALEAAVYLNARALSAFLDVNVAATLRRAHAVRDAAAVANVGQWREELRILAPALELAPLGLLCRGKPAVWLLAGWLVSAAAAIAVAGEYYDRHFVLLVPPVAGLAAIATVELGTRMRAPRLATTLVLLATFGLHAYYEVEQGIVVAYHRAFVREPRYHAGDYIEMVEAVRTRMGDDRSLYVLQASPMLYEDAHAPAPTRYVFSGDLLERGMWPMLGFPGTREIAHVLAMRPHFVAVGPLADSRLDRGAVALVRETLRRRYDLVDDAHRIAIYRLRAAYNRPSTSSTK